MSPIGPMPLLPNAVLLWRFGKIQQVPRRFQFSLQILEALLALRAGNDGLLPVDFPIASILLFMPARSRL